MAGPRQSKRADNKKSTAKGSRILIVEARYYDEIADALLAGAKKALAEAGAQFEVISVPGALEIPTAIAIAIDAAQRKRKPYDGAVGLGCVIRGETIHFDIVSDLHFYLAGGASEVGAVDHAAALQGDDVGEANCCTA